MQSFREIRLSLGVFFSFLLHPSKLNESVHGKRLLTVCLGRPLLCHWRALLLLHYAVIGCSSAPLCHDWSILLLSWGWILILSRKNVAPAQRNTYKWKNALSYHQTNVWWPHEWDGRENTTPQLSCGHMNGMGGEENTVLPHSYIVAIRTGGERIPPHSYLVATRTGWRG